MCFILACNESDGPKINGDIPLNYLGETFALPILSYRIGVQDLLGPIDYDFSNQPESGIVTLTYVSDTLLKIIDQSVQIVNPDPINIQVDMSDHFQSFGNLSLEQAELFSGITIPTVNLDAPGIDDQITLPNATYFPNVTTPVISFNMDDRISNFELINGILRIRGSNNFASDVSFDYNLISDGEIIDSKSLYVRSGDEFDENHVVDFVGLNAIPFGNLEIQFVNFTFIGGTVANTGDIQIFMEINDGWVGRMTFNEPLTFDLDTLGKLPIEIQDYPFSTVNNFQSSNGKWTFDPNLSPISSSNELDFSIAYSTIHDLNITANVPFESRTDYLNASFSSSNLSPMDSLRVTGRLTVEANERLTYDSGNPTFSGTLRIVGLDSQIKEFEGLLDRSFELPVIFDDISISLLRNSFLVNNAIDLPAINLKIKSNNSYGVPFELQLTKLELYNGDELMDSITNINQNIFLIREKEIDSLTFPLGEFQPIFDLQPNRISFSFQPSLSSTSNNDEFVETDSTTLGLEFNIPLEIDISGIQYYDSTTLPYQWEREFHLFENMRLEIGVKNQFPLDFVGQIFIIDAIDQSRIPLVDGGIAFPSSPNETISISRQLPDELMNKLIESRSLVFELEYDSNGEVVSDLLIEGEDELLLNCKILQPAPKN